MENVKTSIEEMKAQIVNALEGSENDALVRKVWDMVEEQRKRDTIVGYRPGGAPITEWELEIQTLESIKEMDNGIFFTQEEMENEFDV
jgi:hypothetical protein